MALAIAVTWSTPFSISTSCLSWSLRKSQINQLLGAVKPKPHPSVKIQKWMKKLLETSPESVFYLMSISCFCVSDDR
jgi:hypothetical protein